MQLSTLIKAIAVKALVLFLLICGLTEIVILPYQFIHFATGLAFAWLTYLYWKSKQKLIAVLCIIGVLLHNPLRTIPFEAKYYWLQTDKKIVIAMSIWIALEVIWVTRLRRSTEEETINLK